MTTPSSTPRRMFVVSDLHLGGRPPSAGDPGFQMCSAEGQARLAQWVRFCKDQIGGARRTEIVLAGDIVDFLAEETFAPFTADDAAATKKLATVLDRTAPIWDALRDFVAAGGELTLLLGNHDLELCLPGPRRLLMDRLGRDTAPRFLVDFLDDNRARVEGPAVIEHGNRYDAWNVVPHDKLRQARSALSRDDPDKAPKDLDMPGSHLVIEVMNDIKRKYRFVDLLKPERQGALPLLLALAPDKLKHLPKLAALRAQVALHRVDQESRAPRDRGQIGARKAGSGRKPGEPGLESAPAAALDPADARYFELARELAGETKGRAPLEKGQIRSRGGLERLSEIGLGTLYKALRAFAEAHHLAYSITDEDADYLKPAKALAKRGFSIVVFGHTHLAKRVDLGGGATYLNTGTWADLMRLPAAILEGADEAGAQADLLLFADALASGDYSAHIRQLPTFVQIDLGPSGGGGEADVYLFQKDGSGAKPIPKRSLWEVWDDYR